MVVAPLYLLKSVVFGIGEDGNSGSPRGADDGFAELVARARL